MIKKVLFVLALITAFIFGYLCGLLWAYDEVVVENEIMFYEPEPEIMVEEEEAQDVIFLGEFKVTAYCPCVECSGGWGYKTSTGAKATEGRTIAVDPSIIPYGTEVIVNGNTYVAEDCGGLIKGNRIDVFLNSHKDVESYGLQKHDVYLIEV